MRLSLKKPPETVCSEDLKCPEKHKKLQPSSEQAGIYPGILPGSINISLHKPVTEGFRVPCPRLPDKRSHIIMHRSALSSLEIYKIRLAVMNHDIPCLKIPVHESIVMPFQQFLRKEFKILFKSGFIEFQPRSLQKTVFEIIQVRHHHPAVELRLRPAHAEVQPLRSLELDFRQTGNGFQKQGLLLRTVISRLPSGGHGIKKAAVTEILLQIIQAVSTDRHHLGDAEALASEMPGHAYKRLILLHIGACHSHKRLPSPGNAEILPVAAGGRKRNG